VTGRLATLLTTLGVAVIVVSTIAAKPAPVYIWNASESVPIGLYRLRPADRVAVSQLVAVQSPEPLATFLADRRYLPRGIPLLKRVLALPGQTVCRDQLAITVDKIEMGTAREHDGSGRQLPIWEGCHVIAGGEVQQVSYDHHSALAAPPTRYPHSSAWAAGCCRSRITLSMSRLLTARHAALAGIE